jgi:hypothetical protein
VAGAEALFNPDIASFSTLGELAVEASQAELEEVF